MIATVDGYRDKAGSHEVRHKGQLPFLVSSRTMKRDHDRPATGRSGGLDENAGHALFRVGGKTECDVNEAVGGVRVFRLRSQWNAWTIDELEKIGTGVRGASTCGECEYSDQEKQGAAGHDPMRTRHLKRRKRVGRVRDPPYGFCADRPTNRSYFLSARFSALTIALI